MLQEALKTLEMFYQSQTVLWGEPINQINSIKYISVLKGKILRETWDCLKLGTAMIWLKRLFPWVAFCVLFRGYLPVTRIWEGFVWLSLVLRAYSLVHYFEAKWMAVCFSMLGYELRQSESCWIIDLFTCFMSITSDIRVKVSWC